MTPGRQRTVAMTQVIAKRPILQVRYATLRPDERTTGTVLTVAVCAGHQGVPYRHLQAPAPARLSIGCAAEHGDRMSWQRSERA